MNIELSKAEIDSILKDKSNPLYRRIQDLFPVEIETPLPTLESLYGEGKIEGFYLNSALGDIWSTTLKGTEGYINKVNGVASTESAVERTILEYKIQHLIKANKLEGNAYKLVCESCRAEILAYKSDGLLTGVLQLSGSADEVQQFITNYKELLLEYFSKF